MAVRRTSPCSAMTAAVASVLVSGTGTLGGAIRYIPNKPQFDEMGIEIRGDVYQIEDADDLSSDIGITLNLPVSDTLAFR
ncbi:MAG: hypothetical protein V7746_24000, partial [Halioglobus sp.]